MNFKNTFLSCIEIAMDKVTIIEQFVIQLEDEKHYLVTEWQKTEITSSACKHLEKAGIPRLYREDLKPLFVKKK